jgi:hypothetical protein
MTIEIVDFPIKNGRSFNSNMLNYQRVHSMFFQDEIQGNMETLTGQSTGPPPPPGEQVGYRTSEPGGKERMGSKKWRKHWENLRKSIKTWGKHGENPIVLVGASNVLVIFVTSSGLLQHQPMIGK